MKPFIGKARYYNNPGQADYDVTEFIWAKEEYEAHKIMVREHPDSEDVAIIPFLTI